MKIWLDADSLPRELRSFVVRRAKAFSIKVMFVANREIDARQDDNAIERKNAVAYAKREKLLINKSGKLDAANKSDGYEMVICEQSPGAADDYIAANVQTFDMVITRDIPFAARLVQNNICVLNDRGASYTKESVEKKLRDRNYNLMLAEIGFSGKAKKSYGKKEFDAFAHCFERELMRLVRDETHS